MTRGGLHKRLCRLRRCYGLDPNRPRGVLVVPRDVPVEVWCQLSREFHDIMLSERPSTPLQMPARWREHARRAHRAFYPNEPLPPELADDDA